jgi:hypothetical protein
VQQFSEKAFFGDTSDQLRKATPAEQLRLADGFRAELLYTVPIESQGSWVCLTTDDRGRLITSAQWGGLYRITPPPIGGDPQSTKVEPIDAEIGNAQGLLYAHDALYVVMSSDESGLYRVRDIDDDDQFDDVALLRAFEGDGEHGPHAVILAPDGNSLYVVGGNGSYLTKPPERSLVPRTWREDRLVRRMGASDGEFETHRPGAWICRTDLDGKQFELVAMGLRNPYDIAFNTTGELFTFDSDMEWDEGTPWYRPTRVNHVISGADFGWRAGTAKWPDDYIDSFGSVVDIGFSSPTGITFGTGAHFPAKYQESLFLCDWSLGNVYSVHLTPSGGSYRGEAERFVTAAPLPVTDIVINPVDGALYFTTGGRGITSALYRITYVGIETTNGVRHESDSFADERQLRHQPHLLAAYQKVLIKLLSYAVPVLYVQLPYLQLIFLLHALNILQQE